MPQNPFPGTDLRPETDINALTIDMHRHYCYVWKRQHSTDSVFAWTLSCS